MASRSSALDRPYSVDNTTLMVQLNSENLDLIRDKNKLNRHLGMALGRIKYLEKKIRDLNLIKLGTIKEELADKWPIKYMLILLGAIAAIMLLCYVLYIYLW